MKRKVVVTQALHDEAMQRLRDQFEVVVPDSGEESTLIQACEDAQAIVLRTNTTVSRTVIEQCPQLKIVSRTGVGVDNVDVEAASEHGILVCNVVGVNSVSVAEHAVTLMLAVLKRICAMDAAVRSGNWNARRGNTTREAAGKTVGVIGMGNIGRRVAAICSAGLGMRVLAYDPYAQDAIVSDDYTVADTLEQVFAEADIVSLHCPNLPETRNLANRELLSKMKPSAILVNTARGEVVDEEVLVELLKEKRIAGAALDVFEVEPPASDHPLMSLENVVLSPHVAALTQEVSSNTALEAVNAVLDCLAGRTPKSVYNRNQLSISRGGSCGQAD